jgi:DNA-binding beta-propeller fold protein YncE
VLDLEQGKLIAEFDAGTDAAAAVPSGTGTYLLVPNTARPTLAVFRSANLRDPALLKSEAGATSVYTAWLDSVAFVPSEPRRQLLVYDLDAQHLTGEIALPGQPTRGAVTSDSRKLYLPVLDPPAVVVVDGETRQLVATIPLHDTPLAAVVAGGWGICH